jgi:hypothetical protein
MSRFSMVWDSSGPRRTESRCPPTPMVRAGSPAVSARMLKVSTSVSRLSSRYVKTRRTGLYPAARYCSSTYQTEAW